MRTLLVMGLVGSLGLHTSCSNRKHAADSSRTPEPGASSGEYIENVSLAQIDISRELSPELTDNLTASQSSLDFAEIGSNVGASFKFGSTAVFDIGAGMKFDDVFQRNILHEIVVGRAKDVNGTGDTNGVFVDKDTVAANRFIKCKSQKVISDSNSFGASASAGISFLGLELGTRVGTGRKLTSSTDYTMNRGFYKTNVPVALNSIFELCRKLAKSDIALQNIKHISEVIKLNFSDEEGLEEVAKKVARGEKVNNFRFHNMQMDFQILKRGPDSITYTVYPDTHFADPRLEIEVKYQMENARAVIAEVIQMCKDDCQNYHDSQAGHGLKSLGETLSKDQAEKYLKLIATVFTAVAMDSK